MSGILLDCNSPLIKNKRKEKSLLDEMESLSSTSLQTSSISGYRPKKEKKKKNMEDSEETAENGENWLSTISAFKMNEVKGSKSGSRRDIFDVYDEKKKKKKKKKKDEAIDYGKEFEPDMHHLHNLLADQIRFTDSLQKRYNILDSSKSTARGIGKFTTDLISSINQARSTSLQITDKIINTKKTIADLSMKQKKEMSGMLGDGEDLNAFSSRFLNQILKEDRHNLSSYGDASPEDGDDDDIFANINDQLMGDEREEEVDKYLEYERSGVEVVAAVNRETNDYHLEAVLPDGRVLDDYPLPDADNLSINHSTGIASDKYHSKYRIKWE